MYEPDSEVSVSQSIFELRKEIKNIAKENGLKYSAFSHNELFYISLIPYPIYIGIERETGDFSISAPHITTRHFSHSYYKAGFNWIRDYLAIDVKPLTEQIDSLREKFYLNSKSSEIVTVSIKALCDSILGKKLIPYELNQNRLLSVILFQTSDKTTYEIEIFHKPFSKDASLLIKLLNEPREIKIPDVLSCAPVHCYGEEINENTNLASVLNGLAGKKTLVSIYNPADDSRWDEVVLPITKGALNGLLYTRWVKQREADVERWSNGRLGYVHIQSMNDGSFRTIYSDILGKYNKKEGIVIDTRFNGGGRLHEDVEILFSGNKYFTQVIRGREACDMPSRRWNKPSIMLQCEANYSNAHGTPYVYKFNKLGKLVGMPVPGTMTSVSWETLQDPTLVFGIPIVGYRVDDGSYLENKQLEPDVKVANSPETIVKGEDTQLRIAVEELLKDLSKK